MTHAKSTKAERDAWMEQNKTKLENLSKKQIIEAMRREGLVAKSTYWMDVSLTGFNNH